MLERVFSTSSHGTSQDGDSARVRSSCRVLKEVLAYVKGQACSDYRNKSSFGRVFAVKKRQDIGTLINAISGCERACHDGMRILLGAAILGRMTKT